MLNLKKALENNIIHFKNDDEFYEWCVVPKIVLINETDKFGNEYKVADFNLSEAYNDAINIGKYFMIEDENSQICKHGCVSYRTISKPIQNLETYFNDKY